MQKITYVDYKDVLLFVAGGALFNHCQYLARSTYMTDEETYTGDNFYYDNINEILYFCSTTGTLANMPVTDIVESLTDGYSIKNEKLVVGSNIYSLKKTNYMLYNDGEKTNLFFQSNGLLYKSLNTIRYKEVKDNYDMLDKEGLSLIDFYEAIYDNNTGEIIEFIYHPFDETDFIDAPETGMVYITVDNIFVKDDNDFMNEVTEFRYTMYNNIVVALENNNPQTFIKDSAYTKASDIVIRKVGKAGYDFYVESGYNILNVINDGYAINYVITTTDENGKYEDISYIKLPNGFTYNSTTDYYAYDPIKEQYKLYSYDEGNWNNLGQFKNNVYIQVPEYTPFNESMTYYIYDDNTSTYIVHAKDVNDWDSNGNLKPGVKLFVYSDLYIRDESGLGGRFESINIEATGGTISSNNRVFTANFYMLNVTVKPASGYTFVGFYINGVYVKNSYNTLTMEIDLSDYFFAATDIIFEARFVKRVNVEYRIAVNNSTSKEDIEPDVLKQLTLSGSVTNIYNSLVASYQLGDKVYSVSTNITDIKITSDITDLIFIVNVPYGTKLNFKVDKTNPSPYKFNGWYLYKNLDVSLSTDLVSHTPGYELYAIDDDNTKLSFVAKFSALEGNTLSKSTSIEIKSYDDNSGELVVDTLSFNDFYSLHMAVADDSPVKYNQGTILKHIYGDETNPREYLFTGWWQVVSEGVRVLVDTRWEMDAAKRASMIAVFVEIRQFSICYTELASMSFDGYWHIGYNYIQTLTDTPVLSASHSKPDTYEIQFKSTIMSSFFISTINPQNGFRFRDENGTYDANNKVKHVDLKLFGGTTYDNEFSISSNLSEFADAYIRYSKIYSDQEAHENNVLTEREKDTIDITVTDNANSFEVTIDTFNETTGFDAKSTIEVVTSDIIMPEASAYDTYRQQQRFASVIKYVSIEGTRYYYYSTDGNHHLYKTLTSYRVEKKVVGNADVYFITTVVEGKETQTNVEELRLNQTGGKIGFITNDKLTLYTFEEELECTFDTTNSTDKTLVFTINGDETVYSETIVSGVVSRYYTMYSYVTISLTKMYQTESFVGFRIIYANGESVSYSANQVGYVFTFVVNEAITVQAVFRDAAPITKDTIENTDPANPATPTPELNYSGNNNYGDTPATRTDTFATITAGPNRFMYSISFTYNIGANYYPTTISFNFSTGGF